MTTAQIFSRFGLSKFGFLPAAPIASLDSLHPCFQPWESVMLNLSSLLRDQHLRFSVNSLSPFPSRLLTLPWHHQRAYVVLSMLTNAYIFSSQPPIESVPAILAVPLHTVSNTIGIHPVLTHAAVDLYNWHLHDPNIDLTLDNLRSNNLFTGQRDEEWFFLIMVAIERVGADILRHIVDIKHCIDAQQPDQVLSHMLSISSFLDDIYKILLRIHENCKPEFFYNTLRPFLSGSKNNDNLPNGLLYQGVSDTPFHLYGGSAAESSLFQTIDAALGIMHNDAYFIDIRSYMPRLHRQFIEWVSDNVRIDQFVLHHQDTHLSNVFSECVGKVHKFRKLHFGIVGKFIIRQSSTGTDKGTGGTELKKFLNQSINETTT